jgi:hypothetical protein
MRGSIPNPMVTAGFLTLISDINSTNMAVFINYVVVHVYRQ